MIMPSIMLGMTSTPIARKATFHTDDCNSPWVCSICRP
ncbi:Uncharacterised protein [Bordetella parapertussis]|nr:Uncharacterised protein [Bordetella parapertussis]SUV58633.1 Uncharacterised protein [Bordetella parapertussis]SUV79166.1 Uncharacterised protein [Bordetella parapertussis]VEF52639.1 Uncharacterised protein [Bordetella parapertussis]VTR30631.1 Uncharacterised protein [Bordetella parapertussis]